MVDFLLLVGYFAISAIIIYAFLMLVPRLLTGAIDIAILFGAGVLSFTIFSVIRPSYEDLLFAFDPNTLLFTAVTTLVIFMSFKMFLRQSQSRGSRGSK